MKPHKQNLCSQRNGDVISFSSAKFPIPLFEIPNFVVTLLAPEVCFRCKPSRVNNAISCSPRNFFLSPNYSRLSLFSLGIIFNLFAIDRFIDLFLFYALFIPYILTISLLHPLSSTFISYNFVFLMLNFVFMIFCFSYLSCLFDWRCTVIE